MRVVSWATGGVMSLALRFSTFRLYTGLEVVAALEGIVARVARDARAARRGERRRGGGIHGV